MIDIECPHCEEVQSDAHNGGDPGPWWHNDHIPEGDCEVECDRCGKDFIVEVSWHPTFTGKLPEFDEIERPTDDT